jgi:hypothetical protein
VPEPRPLLAPLLIPTPVPGETPASFARRLENRLGARHGTYFGKASSELRRLGITDPTVAQQYDQLADLLRERCGLTDDHFEPGLWDMTRAWCSCPQCGPLVELDPRRAHWVCDKHGVWTGAVTVEPHDRLEPASPGPLHGLAMDSTVVTAAASLEEGNRTHPKLVGECLRRAVSTRSCVQRQDAQPEDLPAAAVLLKVALNRATLEELFTAIDTSVAYERLRIRVAEASAKQLSSVIEPQLAELTDQAWLLMRPTVVLARVASGQDVAVDAIDPVVPLPANLAGTALNVVPGEWLTYLKTARADNAWWNDRFMVRSGWAAIGSSRWMLLCPAGHCLHDSPSRIRRYPDKEFHCTVCAGSRAIEGITSLKDTDPALAEQWDHELNGDLTAGMVLRGSRAMVSWRCAERHPWQATVANRALRGSGCPYCSAKGVLLGFNDLATTHPRLSAFWDSDVEQKQPHQVSAGNATVKIHLRCAADHRFVRTPAKLVSRPFCPICDGRTAAAGLNDLATTHPEIASWWHPSRNGNLKPSEVKAGSEKRAWWLCPDGHEYQQQIQYRAKQAQQQCPVDTGRLVLTGVNDLATKHPDLVSDWDHERNDVDPTQVVPGTKKHWWTCKHGHAQCTTVRNRARSGGCTACRPANRIRALRRDGPVTGLKVPFLPRMDESHDTIQPVPKSAPVARE